MMEHDNIITTATGGFFNYSHPEKSQINVVDIAHALSNICRFSGHTKHFYSVAEHSILCYSYCIEFGAGEEVSVSPQTLMYALMHDAAEAFISDIPSPFKSINPVIRVHEVEILSSIFELLELDLEDADKDLVLAADRYMLFKEAKDLLNPSTRFRHVWGPQIAPYPAVVDKMMSNADTEYDMDIQCLDPDQAKATWLSFFNELRWRRI